MSGDSTEGKYPEQAILYKQKCDWRTGEGEGGRATALWFYFISFWRLMEKFLKYL